MSLMSRVAQTDQTYLQNEIEDRDESSLSELMEFLKLAIPSTRMADMIEKNPGQAKNEIRLACEQIFSENPWLIKRDQSKADLVDQLLDAVFGFGPLEDLLSNDDVTEIMVNGSKSLFYEKEGVIVPAEQVFSSDEQVYALIDKIVSPLGRRIDESSPMVNARLVEGHRVNAIIPPLSLDGPIVTIRKFRSKVYSLQELRELESFDENIQKFLSWAVKRRCNIAVSGGTGSGKTTLLNALSCEIPFSERIITVEDSAELRFFNHPHVVRLEARPKNAEGVGEVTIRDLVINTLRMRPDRIVVGECRGAEALDMLQAMNTGHDGSLTTLHANSPNEAISRLTTMVRYAVDLPVEVIESQIASAIDLVIQIARAPNGKRFVTEIVMYEFSDITHRCICRQLYVNLPLLNKCKWLEIPLWIDDLEKLGIANAQEVELWKRRVLSEA